MLGEDFFERSSRLLRSFQVEAHCLLDTEMPQIHRFDLFVIGSGAGDSGRHTAAGGCGGASQIMDELCLGGVRLRACDPTVGFRVGWSDYKSREAHPRSSKAKSPAAYNQQRDIALA